MFSSRFILFLIPATFLFHFHCGHVLAQETVSGDALAGFDSKTGRVVRIDRKRLQKQFQDGTKIQNQNVRKIGDGYFLIRRGVDRAKHSYCEAVPLSVRGNDLSVDRRGGTFYQCRAGGGMRCTFLSRPKLAPSRPVCACLNPAEEGGACRSGTGEFSPAQILVPAKRQARLLQVFPKKGADVSGSQSISLVFDPDFSVGVRSVSYVVGRRRGKFKAGEVDVRVEPGLTRIQFCARCVKAPKNSKIELKLEFDRDSGLKPLSLGYRLNREPRVKIQRKTDPRRGIMIFNASASRDPEGRPLQFTWTFGGKKIKGPVLKASLEILEKSYAHLRVSDGSVAVDQIADRGNTYSEESQLTLPCVNMKTVTFGHSILNERISGIKLPLGPDPAPGTRLDVDAAGNLRRPYTISYGFEILAILDTKEADPPTRLIHGQDIAATSEPPFATGPHKIGKRRDPSNPTRSTDPAFVAPFPDPMPAISDLAAGNPPTVMDNYANLAHGGGHWAENKPGGYSITPFEAIGIVPPDPNLVESPAIAWVDKPGWIFFQTGTSMRELRSRKLFFHAWAQPELQACQQFLVVDLEVKNGVVTRNELKVLR